MIKFLNILTRQGCLMKKSTEKGGDLLVNPITIHCCNCRLSLFLREPLIGCARVPDHVTIYNKRYWSFRPFNITRTS